jgi:hypothetical protein
MTSSNSIQSRPVSASDTLISGLIHGVIAGVGMLLWLLLAGMLAGDAPAVVLERFLIPSQSPNPLSSIFLHLGVSAVYGGIFGILLRWLPSSIKRSPLKLLAGLVYGLLLYMLASTVLLPGTNSPLAEIHALTFASAHLVYGAVLGALTRA